MQESKYPNVFSSVYFRGHTDSKETIKMSFFSNTIPFCYIHMCAQKSQLAFPLLFCLIWSLQLLWERVLERKKECVPPLQFGEIYEWTKPKSVRVYTQREFGRRDLRSAVWVIIQSSRSHISHFESHRLWERTDLSYTGSTCAGSERQRKAKTTHAHKLIHQMVFHS